MIQASVKPTTAHRHVAVLCRDTVLLLDIGMTLRDAGYTVTEVTSMELVPEAAETLNIAILDIGRDVQAAREVALSLDGRKIPMVLIRGAHETGEEFADIDVVGRIEKPFLPAALLPILTRGLRARAANRPV